MLAKVKRLHCTTLKREEEDEEEEEEEEEEEDETSINYGAPFVNLLFNINCVPFFII